MYGDGGLSPDPPAQMDKARAGRFPAGKRLRMRSSRDRPDHNRNGQKMRKTNATSVDVARRAGVSQSTVSRAFSSGADQPGVSAATRRRILAAAEELGYRPNALARSLITRRSPIVGVLFTYLDNPF